MLPAVFSMLFLVIRNKDFAINREVNELTDGHARVHTNGLLYRYFKRPMAAETYISFAGRGMDIYA